MTEFERINAMNIDEFVDWFVANCMHDGDPAITWWDKTYCKNCESVEVEGLVLGTTMECAWCEVNNKCKFFKDMDNIPNSKQMTKIWLQSEVE